MIFGDLGGLKLLDICLTGEEKPRKTSPRKPVPTGDRTRARCVTGAHAAAWLTAVGPMLIILSMEKRHEQPSTTRMPRFGDPMRNTIYSLRLYYDSNELKFLPGDGIEGNLRLYSIIQSKSQ